MISLRSVAKVALAALAASTLCTTGTAAMDCPRGTAMSSSDMSYGKEERCVIERTGKRHGPFRTWHRSGRMRQEGEYRFGRAEGVWTYYYPSGQKRMEGGWRFGKAHGPWTFWHENGQIESEGQLSFGKRVGSWTYRDENGNVRMQADWVDGQLDPEGEHAAARQHR